MKPSLITIFFLFFKISATTFGGGYAMLPTFNLELCEKRGWATEEEIAEYYAVGQCVPGVASSNVAAFVGYKTRGKLGGIIAALGIAAPSFILAVTAGTILKSANVLENDGAARILRGVTAAVCAVITVTVVELFRKSVVDFFTLFSFIAVFVCAFLFGIASAPLAILAALIGILFRNRKNKS